MGGSFVFGVLEFDQCIWPGLVTWRISYASRMYHLEDCGMSTTFTLPPHVGSCTSSSCIQLNKNSICQVYY